MTLFPQDLGPRWHRALFTFRQRGKAEHGAPSDSPPRRPGWLDRFITQGVELDDRQAATVLGDQRTNNGCVMTGASVLGLFMALVPFALSAEGELPMVVAAVMATLVAALGPMGAAFLLRSQMRAFHRPLSAAEVRTLREIARDDLERALLDLAADAIELKLDPKLRPEIVAAYLGIAEAVERLPRVDVSEVDAAQLRADAAQLLQQSHAETDEATAASIRRRAQAHLQQAEAADHCRIISRRTDALREEILAQIHALRTALVAMQSRTDDQGSLADLAEAARNLAGEAVNVAAAHSEIDTLSPPAEQAVIRTGVST